MSNPCEGCPTNCCKDFLVTTEPFDPTTYRQTLEQFPFIRQNPHRKVVRIYGHEVKMHTHTCDRFDEQTQECEGYGTIPRPPFCSRTGVVAAPHVSCLLKPSTNKY